MRMDSLQSLIWIFNFKIFIMKTSNWIPAIMLALSVFSWGSKAQEIIGYSDFFIFDTRFTEVSGTITNAENGYALANAAVNLEGPGISYSASSQADGSYNLGDVPTGNYLMTVIKLGFEEYTGNVFINGEDSQTIDASLTPGSSTYVLINDSTGVFGDNIVENPPGVFTLTGNVSINHVMYFDGPVTVDKRAYLTYPEISGG